MLDENLKKKKRNEIFFLCINMYMYVYTYVVRVQKEVYNLFIPLSLVSLKDAKEKRKKRNEKRKKKKEKLY